MKLCNVIKFFEKGDKVKVFICFKGCVIIYKEIGQCVLDCFFEVCVEVVIVEIKLKMDGCSMFLMFVLKNEK